jgi:hypothetical protein
MCNKPRPPVVEEVCYIDHPGGGTIRDNLRSDLPDSDTLDAETSDSEHTVWTRDPEERTVPVAVYERAMRAPSDLEESTKPSWARPAWELRDSLLEERTVRAVPASAEETAKLGIFQAQTIPKIQWLSEAVTHKLPAVLPRSRKKRRRPSAQDELAMTAAKSGLAGLAVSVAVVLAGLAMVLLGLV